MDLKKCNIKYTYDTLKTKANVVEEFYIPCLSNSVKYDRCSAYFSSTILKKISKGLNQIYRNKGKIRFIFSCQINPNEIENIEKGYLNRKIDKMSEEIDFSFENNLEICNLSFLIEIGLVEVKFAFLFPDPSFIMHMKTGFFEDDKGNKIFFEGSANETEAGILKNAEIFNVYTNFWSFSDSERVKTGEERFNEIWNNTYKPGEIICLEPTEKMYKKLMSFSKHKIFNDLTSFLKESSDFVYVDLDEQSNKILFYDFTEDKILSIPRRFSLYFQKKWTNESQNFYSINDLSVSLISQIKSFFKKSNIKYVFSEKLDSFVEQNELLLDKRIKLALSIKNNQNQNLWITKYEKFKAIVNYETSKKFPLLDRQMKNSFFHYVLRESANFSVPGTGKTFITYGLFSYLQSKKTNEGINKMIVFGPINCFRAWKEEQNKLFSGTHNRFSIYDSSLRNSDFKNDLLSLNTFSIYLINYEKLNSNENIDLIGNIIDKNTFIVFDEIHRIKSHKGKRANNFLNLFKKYGNKIKYKLILTGTPIPNSLSDIWNYFQLLYGNDDSNFSSSLSLISLQQSDNNPNLFKKNTALISHLFVRTTKKDLNVPPPEKDDISSLSVYPSAEESKLFEIIWSSYKNFLVKYIRLIQASSNPKLLLKSIDREQLKTLYSDDTTNYDGEINENDLLALNKIDVEPIQKKEIAECVSKIQHSTKFKTTINHIIKLVNGNKKVIVWCLFVDTIFEIKSFLRKKGILAESITGSDEILERNKKIDLFKKNGNEVKIDVLITNPNTLAESVSLHDVCHDAVYYEFGFNLTYMIQSKDRINRVGLDKKTKTNYYFSITKPTDNFLSSIDCKIYEKLKFKEKRMIDILESNNLILYNSSSDLDDIKEIVQKI